MPLLILRYWNRTRLQLWLRYIVHVAFAHAPQRVQKYVGFLSIFYALRFTSLSQKQPFFLCLRRIKWYMIYRNDKIISIAEIAFRWICASPTTHSNNLESQKFLYMWMSAANASISLACDDRAIKSCSCKRQATFFFSFDSLPILLIYILALPGRRALLHPRKRRYFQC